MLITTTISTNHSHSKPCQGPVIYANYVMHIGLVGKPESIGTLNGRSRRLSPLSVPMDESAPSNTFISNPAQHLENAHIPLETVF